MDEEGLGEVKVRDIIFFIIEFLEFRDGGCLHVVQRSAGTWRLGWLHMRQRGKGVSFALGDVGDLELGV